MDGPPRLWIPEQPESSPELSRALCMSPVDPCGAGFDALSRTLHDRLRALVGTSGAVTLVSGAVEDARAGLTAALGDGPLLHFVTGPDSERWAETSRGDGLASRAVRLPFGQTLKPEAFGAVLERMPEASTLAFAQVEAASAAMAPLRELAPVHMVGPDRMILVDATYAATTTELNMDRDRIDALVVGAVGFGLPPGLCLIAVSQRAIARLEQGASRVARELALRCRGVEGWLGYEPPGQPLLFALAAQLRGIEQEGFTARETRHWQLAARVRAFAKEQLEQVSEDGYSAYSLSCLRVPEGFDLDGMHAWLAQRGVALGRGRGAEAARTFRIRHSGDTTMEEVEGLLDLLAEAVGRGAAGSA
jgi:alanine-glyoxylate transaminase / serine-glyoxylate transaminase / serine-pyruvate transaminase